MASKKEKKPDAKTSPQHGKKPSRAKLASRRRAIIERRLDRMGSAQVLLFLRDDAGASAKDIKRELGQHFGLHAGSRIELLARTYRRAGERLPPAFRYYPNLGAVLGTVNHEGFNRLQEQVGQGLVDSIHAAANPHLIQPTDSGVVIPNPPQTLTWGLDKLGVQALWDRNINGTGISIAHLDTGADGSHEALQGAIGTFIKYDAVGNGTALDFPYEDSASSNNGAYGHGTHTSATIAGRPVNGCHVGVAPGAQLACAMVIEGGDVMQRVTNAIDWAISMRVKVLSMSLGFEGWDETMVPIMQKLRSFDILPVVAIGNYHAGDICSPGAYTESLSVGACDSTGEIADFSSSFVFQRDTDPVVPDLIGPGVGVLSAHLGGGYRTMSGTSMATPHIAGLAALLRQARPDASVESIEQAIYNSCDPTPDSSGRRSARGLPHAPTALAQLQQAPVP